MTEMRRFELHRDVDVTGMSGVGVVADGILWPNGTASVLWRGEHQSIVYWPDGIQHAVIVHGHGDATRFVFIDEDETEPAVDVSPEAELPNGGTVFDLRVVIARLAAKGSAVFERTTLGRPVEPNTELNLLAHGAATYGWSLAAVLAWLQQHVSNEAAFEAACLVQNIAYDGDIADYCDDVIAALEATR